MLARKRKAEALQASAAATAATPQAGVPEGDTVADPFNLSNDQYYRENRKKLQSTKTRFLHSEPALKLSLVKTHLTQEDLANFHKPKLRLHPGEVVRVLPIKKVCKEEREKARKRQRGEEGRSEERGRIEESSHEERRANN